MADVLEGRVAIQTNDMGHGLISLAYFSKGECAQDRITPCNRAGWARQQRCRKDLEVAKLKMDQPQLFCGSSEFYVGAKFPS